MIGRTIGHYAVVEQLGAGGMGIVYRARDSRLQRDVAIKVLAPGTVADESARRRFSKEALALSRLNHPNIATVHDFDSDGNVDFIVMELIPGSTLHEKAANAALSEEEIVRLGVQLVEGVAAAHAHGVLHRDLKPANVRVTPDGRLKILDFGLAQMVEPPTTGAITEANTSAHVVAGTLPYMPPEQLKGERVDVRADIYAARAVLYELATGRRPFEGNTSAHVIDAILHEAPKPPTTVNRKISAALEQVILKALDKDRERRYQSAKELLVDLERLRTGSDVRVRRPPPRKRSVIASWAAAAAIVAAVFVLNRDSIINSFAPPHNESIAVFPLVNLSKDPQQDYFVDGMTRELITQLGRIESLRVIGSATSMQFKGVRQPLSTVARELKVGKLLSGSVLHVGDRARIDLELSDTRTGRTLWTQAYDQNVRDVLTTQAAIAEAVAREVDVRLTGGDKARLSRMRPVDPNAHAAYLKAIALMDGMGAAQDIERELQRAVSIDPNFSQGWSTFASFVVNRGWFVQDEAPMVAYPRAKEMALKAIALDDSDSTAHAMLATIKLHHEWDWRGAEREFRRAIELNRSDAAAHHIYAHYLMAMDRLQESVAETRKAAELEPLNPMYATCVGWHCLFARQYDDAIATCLSLVNRQKAVGLTYYYLGRVYARKGQLAEAIPALETAVAKTGSRNSVLATLGYVYARAGRRAEAEQVLAELQQRSKTKYVAALDFAVVYAGFGDKEQTFNWLDKAYLERSTWLVHLKWDDRFAEFHADPRFTALLQRMGLPNADAPATPQKVARRAQDDLNGSFMDAWTYR